MSYKLTIIGMQGEKKTIDVANSEEEFRNTTVEELKRKIFLTLPEGTRNYLLSLPESYEPLRLLYTSKQLEDHHTLGHYGIRNRDTLCIIIRLPAGGRPLPEDKEGGIHRTESMEKLKLSM